MSGSCSLTEFNTLRRVRAVRPTVFSSLLLAERVPTNFLMIRSDTTKVTIAVRAERLRYWDTEKKQYAVEPGGYEFPCWRRVGRHPTQVTSDRCFSMKLTSVCSLILVFQKPQS